MRRREFISLLSGAMVTWPFAVHAQQLGRVRRIGILAVGTAADDPQARARKAAFLEGLQQFGWTEGRNVQIDDRWPGSDAAAAREYAAELVTLAPDVILVSGSPAMPLMLQKTRTIPIVFVIVADPVGEGFVKSLAQPGGNATGFMTFEYSLSGKWLEFLKQIAPNMTRAAVLRDPVFAAKIGQFAVIQSVAQSLGIDISPINERDAEGIERSIADFARSPNGGLVVTASSFSAAQHNLIVTLAARYKLPTIYPFRFFLGSSGLISYGPDLVDQYRQAASYVDRILKGEKPADLPVQAPTKYELAINLKTAKALGLTVPSSLLARADEVIE
jgi:putative tryptophan/tyrosine transport system substrate-binding protein